MQRNFRRAPSMFASYALISGIGIVSANHGATVVRMDQHGRWAALGLLAP